MEILNTRRVGKHVPILGRGRRRVSMPTIMVTGVARVIQPLIMLHLQIRYINRRINNRNPHLDTYQYFGYLVLMETILMLMCWDRSSWSVIS